MSNPSPMSPPPVNDPNNQNEVPDARAQRITSIWKAIAGIWTLGALGLCFYWMWDESGLSETICGWQAEILDGSCYVMLNFLGAFLALMAPVIIGQAVLQKVTGVKIDMNAKK